MTFRIHGEHPRLEAPGRLTPADFGAIARRLGIEPIRARKIGYVAARQADRTEIVETRWNGRETTNTAHVGDFVVTSLSPRRHMLFDGDGLPNVYVIAAPTFARLYESTGEGSPNGLIYRPKGEMVFALPLRGGFDIVAPWGERQTSRMGYLLLAGDEVAGNAWEAFAETYEVLCDSRQSAGCVKQDNA